MDMKKAGLIGNILKVVIGAVGVILCLMIIFAEKCPDNYQEVCESTIPIVNNAVMLSIGALILCAVIAVLFGLYYFVTNIGKSKGALIGVVGMAVLAGISYSMATSEVYPEWGADGVTEQMSKISGMGIYFVLILLAIAVVAALFSEVMKLVK